MLLPRRQHTSMLLLLFGLVLWLPSAAHSQQAEAAAPQQPALLGPFTAKSFNFADRYGTHIPFQFEIIDSSRVTNNDHFGGVSIARTILSGSENFLAPPGHRLDCGGNGCSRFENAMALRLALVTHAPVQIGGMVDALTHSYAPGDSISMTFVNRYTGISRGTDEGAHLLRTEVTPSLERWGGSIVSLTKETSPSANVGVVVKGCDGCTLDASAEGGAPIINLSRPMPLGNVARVEVYAPDPRFIVLALDDSAQPLPVSHWTSLTAALDSRIGGSSCGSEAVAKGNVQWPSNDPFRADEAGHGNDTVSHCFAVGSTDGLSAGTVVVIGGEGPELETTRVERVVDRTHFIANARMPHPGPSPAGVHPAIAGDAVTWGGLAGYAAGFAADTVAPRSMSEQDRKQRGWLPLVCDFDECNTVPLYLTPLVMASLPGNKVVVYIDFEAAGHTLNTVGLMSNQPVRPARFAARVVGGKVISLRAVSTGNYRPEFNKDVSLGINSGQTRLPPPRMALAGCRVQPRITSALADGKVTDTRPGGSVDQLGGGLIVSAQVDPAQPGAGCPDGDNVPVQVESHYANPLVAYPAALVYRAIRPGEQRSDLNSAEGYQLWMPPSGEFQPGDNVLASTWPLQFMGDIQFFGRNLGYNSSRFGPVHRWIFRGQSNRNPMIDIMDQTSPYTFYSDAAHGYSPTADGGGFTDAPAGIAFTGAYSNIFNVEGAPRRDVLGTPGSFVDFSCYQGSSVETLCEHNVVNAFNLFTVQPVLGGALNHAGQNFLIDPEHHRWELRLNAPDGVIRTDARIETPALQLGQGGCTGCTLAGETELLGGDPLAAGACATGTVNVRDAKVGSPVLVSASDGALPGGSIKLDAAVVKPSTVAVEICALTPTTPARRRYQVRVNP